MGPRYPRLRGSGEQPCRPQSDYCFLCWRQGIHVHVRQYAVHLASRCVLVLQPLPFAESVSNSEGTRFRRSEQFGPLTHPELVEELFEGTLDIDYQNRTLFDAKIDRNKIKVVSDRRRIINPGMERGALRDMKLWTQVRRRVIYDDDEVGRDVASSVWSAQTPGSMGNLYILDLFSVALNSVAGAEAGSVRYNSTTVYWRENS